MNKYILIILLCLSAIVQGTEEQQSIRIAIHTEPPYAESVNGQYVGAHIEILNLITNKLNKKIIYIACPIARCLILLAEGKADMIIGLRKTNKREQYLAYLPQPYDIQKFPLRFYLRTDSRLKINHYADLQNLNIGTIRGASYFDAFDNDTSFKKTSVNNYSQLIKMLLKKRIDTFLERETSVKPWVDKIIYRNNLKLAKYQYNKSVESYIALSRKSPILFEWTDIAKIQAELLASGAIERIMTIN